MGKTTLTVPFGTEKITVETGWLAKQASGSVLVTMGETVVLVTVTGNKSARPGVDFLPLTCEYIEKMYAGGRIPGGYFKREARPGPAEILNCRLIDRPMRPLFPKHWRSEIQIIATVVSFDKVNDPAICAMVGASAATVISPIPFDGPVAACRVALIDGEYVINPSSESIENAKLELIVAATEDAVTMVEGEGKEASETEMIEAIVAAHEAIKPICKMQRDLSKKAGKDKWEVVEPEMDVALYEQILDLAVDGLGDASFVVEKSARKDAIKRVYEGVFAQLVEKDEELEDRKDEIYGYLGNIQKDIVRTMVAESKVRIDGRGEADIRPITCEVGLLPRTHGSAVFTRGETQALGVVTLGTRRDEQRIDNLYGDHFVNFMLHYNFPPFCTGEAKMLRGTSRREIGHGNLAQR
ncbi:MAG: polyribonucleotide nucleotidyltransferase, partial [Bradymonadia bacterium]